MLNYLPWVSFIAGMTGSLHCVGMCGGLVTFATRTQLDIFLYQIGRLAGYLILALLATRLSAFVPKNLTNVFIKIIPGLILGILFLYWGIESFRGKRAEIPLPSFMNHYYLKLMSKVQKNKSTKLKAFLTGGLSLFLPCGILYTLVLSLSQFDSKKWALLSLLFFWLGTLPAMMLAPSIMQKILNPLRSKIPKIYAIILILIGVGTISTRLTMAYKNTLRPSSELNCH